MKNGVHQELFLGPKKIDAFLYEFLYKYLGRQITIVMLGRPNRERRWYPQRRQPVEVLER